MALTPIQIDRIKTDIAGDLVMSGKPLNSDGAFDIAALYNQEVVPTFWVWKTSAPVNEIMLNGFDWTRVDNLTVGKARIWEWLTRPGFIKPNQDNVRAGVNETFKAAGDVINRAAVFSHCQRPATRIEKLLATGAGTTTTDLGNGPATMGFEGPISYQDIELVRAS